MPIIEIQDPDSSFLAPFSKLTDRALRSKHDPQNGLFLAESTTVIDVALDAGCVPTSVLIERKLLSGYAQRTLDRLLGVAPDLPIYTGDDDLLASLCGFPLSRGIFCTFRRPPLPSPDSLLENATRVGVLEGIVDPTNVGAIMRSAAGLGLDAVLLSPTCSDPLRRRSLRVSMGTALLFPWTYLTDSPERFLPDGITLLCKHGFRTAAMALRDDSIPLDDPRLSSEEKLAIFLGTEGDGLKPETIAACDYTVRIPMANGVDSLNVSTAAALAFWELRKR